MDVLIWGDTERSPALRHEVPLAIGDRIRPFRSTRARFANGREGSIGRNRSVLEVLAIGDQGLTVRNVKSGREGAIAWDKLRAPNGRMLLAYADALTTHAAQGKTAPEYIYSLPSGSQAATGLDAYSSMTRHEWRGHLLTSELADCLAGVRKCSIELAVESGGQGEQQPCLGKTRMPALPGELLDGCLRRLGRLAQQAHRQQDLAPVRQQFAHGYSMIPQPPFG